MVRQPRKQLQPIERLEIQTLPWLRGKHFPIATLIIILGLGLLTACSKVNKVNYEKIQTGMNESEVIEILGNPTETASIGLGPFSGTNSKWISHEGTINLVLANGQVISKHYTVGQSSGSN